MIDSRWSDRLTYDGTWENNLFNFFMRVIVKLTQDLKRPFKLEGMERIDDTPIHKAVREALTNMIIHADLLITGVLKIEKRKNFSSLIQARLNCQWRTSCMVVILKQEIQEYKTCYV